MIVVVDASVAAMWFLPEPESDRAALLLDSDHDLVAPDFLRLEVASALLKAERRGTINATEGAAVIARLDRPLLQFEPAAALTGTAFDLASVHGGSLYDAVYVALARSSGGLVATNDAVLARTARAADVPVWLVSQAMPDALRPRAG